MEKRSISKQDIISIILIICIGILTVCVIMINRINKSLLFLEVERDAPFGYGQKVSLDDFTIISNAENVIIDSCVFEYDKHQVNLCTDGFSFAIPYKTGKMSILFKGLGNGTEITTQKEFEVLDNIKPEIISEYNYDTYVYDADGRNVFSDVYAYDEIDGKIPVFVDDVNVNYNIVGSYMATLFTKDSSDNYTEQTVRVNIHNPDPEIKIIVNTNSIELHPGDMANIENFYSIDNPNSFDLSVDIMIIEPPMDAKPDPYKNIVDFDSETRTIKYSSPGEAKAWILVRTNGYKYYDADIKIVCTE